MTSNRLTLAIACLSLAASISPASGQGGAKAAPAPTPTAQGQAASAVEPTASLDFKGGTLGDYLAAVDRAFGGSNAAVQPGLESVPVGPVKLVDVRRKEAVRSLEVLAKMPPGSSVAVASMGDAEVFRVFTDRRPEPPAPERRVTVWTLAPVLDDKTSAEQVLSAVETALALVPGPADVRYHKDTRLLIVSGTDEHARAIQQVIGSLEQARRRAGPEGAEAENSELRNRIAQLEARLRDAGARPASPAR